MAKKELVQAETAPQQMTRFEADIPDYLKDELAANAGMESISGVGVLNIVIAQGMAEVFKRSSEEYIEEARPGDLYERSVLKQVYKALDIIPVKIEPMYREYGKLDPMAPGGVDYKHFGGYHSAFSNKVQTATKGPKWGTLAAADGSILQQGTMVFFLMDGYPATYFAFSYSTDIVKNFAARCRLSKTPLAARHVTMSAVPVPGADQGDPYQIKLEPGDYIAQAEVALVKEYLEQLSTEDKLLLVANGGRVVEDAQAAPAPEQEALAAAVAMLDEDAPPL